jgi:chromate transporter
MYKTIFLEFFKLGVIAFGGPAGHIALMQRRFVEELKWLDENHFLDLVSVSSLIPGPSSTELTLLIGRHKGGIKGLWIAGISFILPALIMVLSLAYLYIQYGQLDMIQSIFFYVLPVMVSIILFVTFNLSKKVIHKHIDFILLVFSLGLSVMIPQVFVFIILGVVGYVLSIRSKRMDHIHEGITILSLFLIFIYIGSTLYGSGYVLISYLQTAFVQTGLMSAETLLDAVSIGQITPGPVFTTAAFIGYILTGNVFAGVLSAVAIFLPGFIIISLMYPWFENLRRKNNTKKVLHALHIAAIALLVKIIIDYSVLLSSDFIRVGLALVGLVLLMSKKVSPTMLITISIVIGMIVSFT